MNYEIAIRPANGEPESPIETIDGEAWLYDPTFGAWLCFRPSHAEAKEILSGKAHRVRKTATKRDEIQDLWTRLMVPAVVLCALEDEDGVASNYDLAAKGAPCGKLRDLVGALKKSALKLITKAVE